MSDEKQVDQSPAEQSSISEQASAGMRTRRAFMLKQLLPGDGQDWINKNVVSHGKGHKVIAGRVFGVVMGWEEKNNTLPDGKVSKSIALFGQFEYESALTGELGSASSAYLPMAFAQQVAATFASDPTMKALEVDVDLGVEATGKSIPFEWLVINHSGVEVSLIKRLRERRRPGQRAIAAPVSDVALPAPDAPQEVVDTAADESAPAKAKKR